MSDPSELDLKDDKATVVRLFALISFIVQSSTSAKAQIEAMYASLPPRGEAQFCDNKNLVASGKKGFR